MTPARRHGGGPGGPGKVRDRLGGGEERPRKSWELAKKGPGVGTERSRKSCELVKKGPGVSAERSREDPGVGAERSWKGLEVVRDRKYSRWA